MEMELENGTINSRNEIESYQKMEAELNQNLCKKNFKIPVKPRSKAGSMIKGKKSPIDKKDFLNNIQNEIKVNWEGEIIEDSSEFEQ